MGGLVVGIFGYILPETLGVGYDNIIRIFSGTLAEKALIMLCMLKFVSWAVARGSGTSAGTLAPLFVMDGALGAALGGIHRFKFADEKYSHDREDRPSGRLRAIGIHCRLSFADVGSRRRQPQGSYS